MKKKVLIIDNYDSFTYILKQYFGELQGNPEVFFNDHIALDQIRLINPTHIVLSPGPGTVDHPKDVGIMFDVIQKFYTKIPLLGVCLGHQALGKFFGGKIVRAPTIMHGKRSLIYHTEQGIFKTISQPFEAMRYHSLMIDSSTSFKNINITAHTGDGLIMGIEHKKYPVFGVQFHPESLGTGEGKKIIQNFLEY